MVSVPASSVVDRGFESRLGQTKDYKIGFCCFSAKHVAVRRKSKDWLDRNQNNVSEHAAVRRESKDWLARNQNNVSEWSDMSTRGLLFQ